MALAAGVACDSCGLLFPSDELLVKHKSRFCTGSDFDKALIERRRQRNDESSLAPDALASFLAGGAAPKALSSQAGEARPERTQAQLDSELEKLTVAQLRQQIAQGQAGRDKRRAEQEAEAKQAAARISSQRVRAEVQQGELQARLESQRLAELQLRVQRRAAERMLQAAELQSEATTRQAELDELTKLQAEMEGRRQAAEEATRRAAEQLEQLQAGGEAHAVQLDRAHARSRVAADPELSEEGAARRAAMLEQQSAQMRGLHLDRERLLARQRLLHGADEQAEADDDDDDGQPPFGDVWTRRLQRQLDKDDRRIAELARQVKGGGLDDEGPLLPSPRRQHSARSAPPRRDAAPSAARPASAPRAAHAPPPPPQLPELGDGGDSAQLQQDLEQLQRGYAQAGGANTALLEMMARLQRDARELAALPPLPPQPLQPQPPQWLEGAEGAAGAAGDAVPPEVARQLSAMQRALVAQEGEAARLHEQLQSIRGGGRGPSEGQEPSLSRRPSKGAGEFEQVRGRSNPNPEPDH